MTLARLRQNPDIVAREIDDAVFLVGPDDDAVFHLNAIGAAIWRLLDQPVSVRETTQILIDAFPDMPAEHVRNDVERLFQDLEARGFLVEVA